MTPWVWLDERDARTIHERLLALRGGAEGVRDAGLLSPRLPARSRSPLMAIMLM